MGKCALSSGYTNREVVCYGSFTEFLFEILKKIHLIYIPIATMIANWVIKKTNADIVDITILNCSVFLFIFFIYYLLYKKNILHAIGLLFNLYYLIIVIHNVKV